MAYSEFRRGTITGSIRVEFEDGQAFDLDLTYDGDLTISQSQVPDANLIDLFNSPGTKTLFGERLNILQIACKNQNPSQPMFTLRIKEGI
jgi:hypothetical protein